MSFFLAGFRSLMVFDKADIRELIEVYRETKKNKTSDLLSDKVSGKFSTPLSAYN